MVQCWDKGYEHHTHPRAGELAYTIRDKKKPPLSLSFPTSSPSRLSVLLALCLALSLVAFAVFRHRDRCPSAMPPYLRASQLWTENSTNRELNKPLTLGVGYFVSAMRENKDAF